MVNRLAAHANQHSLLPVRQSAYRQHHSAETAAISVHNDVVRATDAGLVVSTIVLLDLSSAFDTIDHEILIDLLRDRFGIEQHELKWFRSYHTGRPQTFKTPDNSSAPVSLTCSVPQGSRIGPHEFTVYTEDMVDTFDSFNTGYRFYADDSQLLTHTSLTAVSQHRRQLELCIEPIKNWCLSRRLQLNRDKKELIWFRSKSKLANVIQLDTNLNICSVVVEPTDSVRDLGVILDSELSMRQHVGKLSSYAFSPPSPASVPVDARAIVATTTHFCISPTTHRPLQCRACWPASLHACTSSACTERSSAVRRRSTGACSHHRYHAVATLATDRLSGSLQALSCDLC